MQILRHELTTTIVHTLNPDGRGKLMEKSRLKIQLRWKQKAVKVHSSQRCLEVQQEHQSPLEGIEN
jgi:hypothetical protein